MKRRRRDEVAIISTPRKFRRTVRVPVRSFGLAPPRTGGFRGTQGPLRRAKDERKVIDVDPASYNANTTGVLTLLNGVATGTDFTNRIGRKIRLKSIYIRGYCQPEDQTTGNNLARMIVVYDMQSNGAAPTVTDILKSATSVAQLNLDNRDRFKVLIDKQLAMGQFDSTTAGATNAAAPTIHQIKKYKKLNLEVLFNGTAATVGSIATGSIYMLTIGAVASGVGSTFTVSSRIRFEDA